MSAKEMYVIDTDALFVWSSITDQVRDTTGAMNLTPEAVRALVGKFNLSRSNVLKALSEDAQEALESIAPALQDTVDQMVLHVTAAAASSFLQAVHSAKVFVAQHNMAIQQISEANPALFDVNFSPEEPASLSSPDLLAGSSAYI